MTLRVAISGSHGSGKSYIVSKLREAYPEATHLDSVSRSVSRLGFAINDKADWKAQLLNATVRFYEQRKRSAPSQIFFSDRTLIDTLAYTKWNLQNAELTNDEKRLFGHVAILNEELLKEDAKFWDVIFYKPVHRGFAPESDGVRAEDAQFQKEIELIMVDLYEQMRYSNPMLSDRLITLDPDRDAAADQAYKWISQRLGR